LDQMVKQPIRGALIYLQCTC